MLLILISLFISIIGIGYFKNVYEKLIPLLSISTKISILLLVYSYYSDLPIIVDVAIFYVLISIGGAFAITSFLSRSD
ncbi:hypothetical protein Y592_00370 [Thermosipho sp. 1070]|nr:hypothetical protein Y592_00370 [Thermosipho sp. 1070]